MKILKKPLSKLVWAEWLLLIFVLLILAFLFKDKIKNWFFPESVILIAPNDSSNSF